jgi:hypothetical protein
MKEANQTEVVRKAIETERREEVKEKIKLPGIETLHTKSMEDIAEVLTNVIKSKTNIKEMRWVLGSYIELTWTKPSFLP